MRSCKASRGAGSRERGEVDAQDRRAGTDLPRRMDAGKPETLSRSPRIVRHLSTTTLPYHECSPCATSTMPPARHRRRGITPCMPDAQQRTGARPLGARRSRNAWLRTRLRRSNGLGHRRIVCGDAQRGRLLGAARRDLCLASHAAIAATLVGVAAHPLLGA